MQYGLDFAPAASHPGHQTCRKQAVGEVIVNMAIAPAELVAARPVPRPEQADAERQHGRQSEEISNQSDHVSATGSASGFARRDELRTPCGVLHVMPWLASHADFLHRQDDSTMPDPCDLPE